MIFGPTLIVLAGICGTATLFLYALSERLSFGVKPARVAYGLMTAMVTVASIYLLYLFVTHRFEFQYVFAYSSLDLPLKYVVASFWGGQEGTFLLWLLFGAWLGLIIIRHGRQYERWAMVFYLSMQLFLVIILLIRSPFAPTGMEVIDGRGLNPLLQNPWMVIHPPVVFLGYAALAIPFAYAMAALVHREYADFPRVVFPWASLGVVTLGLGIFLGGYWAYKTLGWGGYWGWDPVENSSLIPWIVALALMHGLIVQRKLLKLVKTNLFLAILTLFLVIYGTFLTRSGVLADFSVHSFTDLGLNAYLVGYMVFVGVVCPGFLLWRARSIKTKSLESSPTSRDFGLTVGLLLLSIIAFLIFLGTSAPLLTRLVSEPANVDLSYYHAISIPSGIAVLLLLVMMPFTASKGGATSVSTIISRITWPGVAAAVVTVVVTLIANLQFLDLLLIFSGLWAMGTNGYAIFLLPHFKLTRIGGQLTHLGFAVMILGIVASTNYGLSERVNLYTGEPQTALGHEITYVATRPAPRVEDSYLELELVTDGQKQTAKPQFFFSEFTQSTMRNPHVVEGLVSDLYIAPLDLRVIEEPGGQTTLQLTEGLPAVYGDYEITFIQFETGSHETGQITVGARLNIVGPDSTITITPELTSGADGQFTSPGTLIPGSELAISLVRIMVEGRAVVLQISDPETQAPGRELLTVDVSTKPLISLVWLGVILITIGTSLSYFYRWSATRKEQDAAD